MRLTLRQTFGRTQLFLITVVGAALFAAVPRGLAFQNPVNLDRALKDKPAQDRAKSYYHFALSKWFEDDGDLARALSEMQTAVSYNENDSSLHVSLAEILARAGRVNEAMDEAQQASRLDPKNPEPHWLLASIHLRSTEGARNRQDALEALKKAVQELEAMKVVAPADQRAYFALGGCYMELGQPEKAIAAYERWQTLVPDADAGYAAIAQYYDQEGKLDKAIEYLQKAVERSPDSMQSLGLLAGLYAKAKREKDAIPLYRKMVSLSGGTPGIKQQLAASLLDSGEFAEAAKILAELFKEDPHDPTIRMMMSRAQVGARNFPEAIETLKSLVAGDPDNIEFQFYLGTAYEQGGQPADAVKTFSRLLEQSKGDSEELKANRGVFQQHLAASYQDMGEYQKAIAIYEEMAKSDPTPRTYFMLINAYRVDRQFDRALSLGKQQLDKNPGDENLALVYARSLADTGKTKDGAEILSKFMQGNPTNLDLYVNLSQIYLLGKRYSDAEKVMLRAQEQKLDSERVKLQLATVYDKQKDYDRAESLLKEILKQDPKDAIALNYIGYLLADRGIRLQEAVDYVQQALVLDPNNGAYLDSLGWAFFKMNDLQQAEKYLLQAVELERKDPVIHDHLGDLYFKIGNLEKAQEFWKRSLTNGGEPEEVQKIRGKLEKVQETIRKQKRSE
jgi:tetratricopeptide (TPR) repeat protein